jgi:hypothetical protein
MAEPATPATLPDSKAADASTDLNVSVPIIIAGNTSPRKLPAVSTNPDSAFDGVGVEAVGTDESTINAHTHGSPNLQPHEAPCGQTPSCEASSEHNHQHASSQCSPERPVSEGSINGSTWEKITSIEARDVARTVREEEEAERAKYALEIADRADGDEATTTDENGPHVPSLQEVEAEHLTPAEELEDARLVQRVCELCLQRGTFVFPSAAVMCMAFGLEDEISPDRIARWAVRRLVIPAADLGRPPGSQDVSDAQGFVGGLHAAVASTLATTTSIGTKVVVTAADWGAWLLGPVVEAAVHTTTRSRLFANWLGSYTSRPSIEAAPVGTAATDTTQTGPSLAYAMREHDTAPALSGPSSQRFSREATDDASVYSFGIEDANAYTNAIDAAVALVLGPKLKGPYGTSAGIVFRPALHKVAARVVNLLLDRTRTGGALRRVMTKDDWSDFVLTQEGIAHVPELTSFLVLHAQVVQPVKCDLGDGIFIALALSTESQATSWKVENAAALLDFKLRATAVARAVEQWEDEAHGLRRSYESPPLDILQRIDRCAWLIEQNKLVGIELHKTLQRLDKPSEIDPEAVLEQIRQRLAHFGDLHEYPIMKLPDDDATKR